MVVVDFLLRFPNNKFNLLYFNHGTTHGQEAEAFVKRYAESKSLELHIGNIVRPKRSEESQEEFWRKQRYEFFGQFTNPIITCHHLNDCVETWIFTSLRGCPKLIPYQRDNYIRPFLTVSKKRIQEWSKNNSVQFIQDPTNFESEHARNIIRNDLMPIAKLVNPGLEKTIKKMILNKYKAPK